MQCIANDNVEQEQQKEETNEGEKMRSALHSKCETIAKRISQKYINEIYAEIEEFNERGKILENTLKITFREFRMYHGKFIRRKVVKMLRSQGIDCRETSNGALSVVISI